MGLSPDIAHRLRFYGPRPRSLMLSAEHELRLIGLALAAMEKFVQIVCERGLRLPEKLHEPWVTRVCSQLLAAYGALEDEIVRQPIAVQATWIGQAGVTLGVAWHFTQQMVPELVPAQSFPALVAYSAAAKALPDFMAAPHADATYRG